MSHPDYSLFGHVFANITVPDVISCTFECLTNQQCLSYNYEDGEVNNCELNDATMETNSHDFHRRPGYKYYDTQKVCKMMFKKKRSRSFIALGHNKSLPVH